MFLHISVILFTGRCVVSQHALQVVSQHALQQVSRGSYPSMPCRFPSPHPRGKLRSLARGISRPTPKGEVEGSGLGGLQAHTQGSPSPNPGGSPFPHPGGSPGPYPGISRSQHALRQTPQWLLLRAVRTLLECILVRYTDIRNFLASLRSSLLTLIFQKLLKLYYTDTLSIVYLYFDSRNVFILIREGLYHWF